MPPSRPTSSRKTVGWSCLTLECRGHGLSEAGPVRPRSGIATFTDDVAALIEAEGAGPVVVGGVSMGAAIALRLAVIAARSRRRARVGAPGLVPRSRHPPIWSRMRWSERCFSTSIRPHAGAPSCSRIRPWPLILPKSPPTISPRCAASSRASPITVTSALLTRISADGPERRCGCRDRRRSDVPTLLLAHGEDFDPSAAPRRKRLAETIPSAHLVPITPKAMSRAAYVSDARAALSAFLMESFA